MTALKTAPDKLYYKIGEVADIVGVKPHVLRYWESELHMRKHAKPGSKQRLYRRRDVDTLLEIKRLLHEERFTIAAARQRLKAVQKGKRRPAASPPVDRAYRSVLLRVRREIEVLYRLLS